MNSERVDRMLFGGSFDPPHRGHLAILKYVFEAGLADAVDLVPAAVSPFKTDAPPAPAAVRLELLRAALADCFADESGIKNVPHAARPVQLHTLELDRPPPSYTVDTLRHLTTAYPAARIGLLIGSDGLADFDRWQSPAEILNRHPLFVFRRPGDAEVDIQARARILTERFAVPDSRIQILENPLVDCASSALRAALYDAPAGIEGIAAEQLLRCLTPGVIAVIRAHGLYAARK